MKPNTEYTLQTGKTMRTVNGKVVVNKQYAFDYDGKKANIVVKNNKDLHEYKLSNKDINDVFTRIMKHKNVPLKERLTTMLEKETNRKKKKKKKTKKKRRKYHKKTKKSRRGNKKGKKKDKKKV